MTFVKEVLTERVFNARSRLMMRGLAVLLGVCGIVALSPDAFGQVQGLDHEGVAVARDASSSPVDAVPDGLTSADWSSIRQAYEAGRHAAQLVGGGYRARNPGQQWRTLFDGRGFTTRPDAGGWSWGLELQSYGFAGQERVVTTPASVAAEGQRVSYAWDDVLTEWYINDARGLEHGYTVHRRPSQDAEGEEHGVLTFTLAVRGELVPEATDDESGMRFVDCNGAAVLTYSGLKVIDADGHALSAGFEHVAEGLRLTVDERGARYPLTIDPIVQQAYLKASNTAPYEEFGFSVAVSDDTVVVCTMRAGAAYVFVRSGTSLSQQAYLKGSNTGVSDWFGCSVAASGDTIVIGALFEDSNATGVNGDQSDNNAYRSGAAYVFVRSGTSWSQQAYLKASNTDAEDLFGCSVAVSGDTIVVGAWAEDSAASGVNGDQSDNSTPDSGAAYVFVRSGTSWSQQAYLKGEGDRTSPHTTM